MPELPDIALYLDVLTPRVVGRRLERAAIKGPFLLRSVNPPIEAAEGRVITGLERLGKRIVFAFEGEVFLVLHLMIAGRLLWKPPGARASGKIDLASFSFDHGTLILTEASPKKRASLHVVAGREGLKAHDPGGVDVTACSLDEFSRALADHNRTLKRALTDPRSFSGIGNAYSDEILHAAKLSPLKRTGSMTPAEHHRLHAAARDTLERWTQELRREFRVGDPDGGRFPGPGEITAFRPGFAVHGKFGQPCPACGSPVQRIVHAENETNYCAICQTQCKVLADRAMSQLLKEDWPRTIEEWEGEFGPGA